MKKSSHGIIQILPLLAVALILIFAVGYYAYKNERVKITPSLKDVSPTPDPSENLPFDKVSRNWKTYTDSKYNFVLNYPEDISPKQLGSGYTAFYKNPNEASSFVFYIDERQQLDYDALSDNYISGFGSQSIRDMRTSGIEGFVTLPDDREFYGGKLTKSAFIKVGLSIIIVGCDTNHECTSYLLDQILSTFRFDSGQ